MRLCDRTGHGAAAAGDRRDHGRTPRRPTPALRLDQHDDRGPGPGIHRRRRGLRHAGGHRSGHRAVHLLRAVARAASQRPQGRYRHQAAERRDRGRQALGRRVRHVHVAAVRRRQRDHPQRNQPRHARAVEHARAMGPAEKQPAGVDPQRAGRDGSLGLTCAALSSSELSTHRAWRGRDRR